MRARRPRSVCRTRFGGGFRRGGGGGGPQRIGQDIAAAVDRGPACSGRRHDRAGRRRCRADALEQCHYLGHRDALKPALSVNENLAFWADFLGGERLDVARSLTTVGLDHATHLPAAFLSAGQRRRLSLARLLTVRRPVWLLDEPTTALDASGQDMFGGLMRDHLACGGLIIAATHAPLGIAARELRIGDAA